MKENIGDSRLPSGLRVVTDAMPDAESIALGLWVGAGTRHEQPEYNGISHLLEHMVFKGTNRRSAQAIAEEMDAIGGQLNAYTTRDHTAYYARVLAGDEDKALDLIADILQDSLFDPEELHREQGVIAQEIAQAEDTPDDIVFDLFQSAAYPDQPLGRPVMGSEASVRSISQDRLFAYRNQNYTIGNAVLSVAGQIKHDHAVTLAERLLDRLPSHPLATPAPAQYQGGEIREERDIEQVNLVLGFGGVSYDDPDYYATSMLSTILGGGMSSRLFQEVREKRGLAYSVYSFASSYHDGGLFGIFAGTASDDVAQLIDVVCDEVRKICDGINPAEMERAQAQLRAGLLMGQESVSGRCENLARNIQVHNRPVTVQEVVDKVMKVDRQHILRTAERLFSTPLTLSAVGPLATLTDRDSIMARIRRG